MSLGLIDSNGVSNNLSILLNILRERQKGQRVCHMNAQSLFCNIDEFRNHFGGSSVNVICISQTSFKASVRDVVYSLKGYSLFHVNSFDRICSATAIYVRSGKK